MNIILSADNLDDICILAQGTRAIVVMDFGLPWRTAERKGVSQDQPFFRVWFAKDKI